MAPTPGNPDDVAGPDTAAAAPAPSRLSGLTDLEIADIVEELAPLLEGGHVGKVREEEGPGLVLEIGRDRLLVSAHPRASRLHLAPARHVEPSADDDAPDRERRPPARPGRRAAGHEAAAAPRGAPASAFAMLLRKRLSGRRLLALRVLGAGERVVELGFGTGQPRLVAELTGPHANVFLVGDDGVIVASLRPTHSTSRPLAPGQPWSPPPAAPAQARWRGRRRFGDPPGTAARAASFYEEGLRRAAEEELRERAAGALRREIDHLERRRRALEGDLARAREAEVFRKYADLLLAHLSELGRAGAAFARVPDDFEDGTPLSIPLDPALDARANASRYYRQYRRLTGGRRRIEERLELTDAELAERRARLERLDGLDLDGLRRAAPPVPPPPRRAARPPPRLPYREFRSIAGDLVKVGRTAADNDQLTFRHARGRDLWLHTRDAPGSHVVVSLRADGDVDEGTLLDAATLAAHFSPLRGEPQVDVSYTRVKNLRKPRGAPPGRVFVAGAKTIRIRIEPRRLERLLSQDPAGRGAL